MKQFTNTTQDIKRFTFSNITHDKATGIGLIIRVVFDDFSCRDYIFNLLKRYASHVTASLSVPCDYILFFEQFLTNICEHLSNLYHRHAVLSRKEKEKEEKGDGSIFQERRKGDRCEFIIR